MNPEVSVIIPLYQCEKYIGAAIESVLAQSFTDHEIIVIDDGSTDSGGRIASSFPRVKYFRKKHSGIAEARNLALSKAKGELIAFLDADDLWTPDKLELQVSYLREHPDCSIVFCRYQNFTDIAEPDLNERQKQVMEKEIPLCLTAACIRKDLFSTYGLFNESYAFGEDTEWLARLQVSLVDLDHKIDKALYLRRIHENNISITHKGMNENERYAIIANAIRSKWRHIKND